MKTYKIIKDKCDVCACCAAVCQTDAIRLTEESAYIIQNKCVQCGKCFIVCPISAIVEERNGNEN